MSSSWSLSPVRRESNSFAELPSASALQEDAEDVNQLFRNFSCYSLPNFHTPDVWGDPNQRWKFSVGESTLAEGRKLNRDAFKKKIQELRLETTKPVLPALHRAPKFAVPDTFSSVLPCNEEEEYMKELLMLQSLTLAMNSPLFEDPQGLFKKLSSPDLNSRKQSPPQSSRCDELPCQRRGGSEEEVINKIFSTSRPQDILEEYLYDESPPWDINKRRVKSELPFTPSCEGPFSMGMATKSHPRPFQGAENQFKVHSSGVKTEDSPAKSNCSLVKTHCSDEEPLSEKKKIKVLTVLSILRMSDSLGKPARL